MKRVHIFLLSFLSITATAQRVPTFEEVIALRSVGGVVISPDGKHIAYTLQTTDWNDNRYDTEIWLSKEGKAPFPTHHQCQELQHQSCLRDNNVPSELMVYKGFGHGINKPKERLAATWHNWQWFNKYVWNEVVELPVSK